MDIFLHSSIFFENTQISICSHNFFLWLQNCTSVGQWRVASQTRLAAASASSPSQPFSVILTHSVVPVPSCFLLSPSLPEPLIVRSCYHQSLLSPAHPLPHFPLITTTLVPVLLTSHLDSDVSTYFFSPAIYTFYRKLWWAISPAFLTSGLSGSNIACSCQVHLPEVQPPSCPIAGTVTCPPPYCLIGHR